MTSEVFHYSQLLCESIKEDFKNYKMKSYQNCLEKTPESSHHKECLESIRNGTYDYNFDVEIDEGRKYLKVVLITYGAKSVHCFIDKMNGNVFKPASFNAPAKGVRYNLLNADSRDKCYNYADWSGSYLYMR
jgi:hypothetical protein